MHLLLNSDKFNPLFIPYKKLKGYFITIEKLFTNVKILGKQTYKARSDKTGKSTITDMSYEFDSKGIISVACQDWSKKLKYTDQLRVQIRDKDYANFLINEAY
mgnify:CR=1 FL=1